jgi:hypothetical protein
MRWDRCLILIVLPVLRPLSNRVGINQIVRLLLGYIFLCCMLVSGCTDAANQKNVEPRTLATQPATENRLPGQYIVTLKESGSSETLTEVFKQYGIKSIQDLSRGRYLITLEQDPGPEEMANQAATASDIEQVQPNFIYRTMPPIQDSPQRAR